MKSKLETSYRLESYLKERLFTIDRKFSLMDLKSIPITIVGCTDLKYDSFFQMYENEAYKVPTSEELQKIGKALNVTENQPIICFLVTAHIIRKREILRVVGMSLDGYCMSAESYIGRDPGGFIKINRKVKVSKNQDKIKKTGLAKMLTNVIKGYKS